MNRRERRRLRRLAALQQEGIIPSSPNVGVALDSNGAATMAQNSPQKVTRQLKVAAYSFSGPLPPPELLGRYNDVIPNGAERIMQMAEKQQEHRQGLEKTVITSNVASEKRGQYMGLFVAVAVIVLGFYLAFIGRQIAGSVFVGADLASLAGVFVLGKRRQRQELAKKNEQFKK
jgi:uncharacterized membrane protein